MTGLQGKTLFITGATRGIGHAIGLRAAQDGANIVIAAKTTEPHPKLPGTIYTAAEDMEQAGGRALALPVDVRDDAGLRDAMEAAAAAFGGIDILVNNASALSLTDTPSTPMKRYDLIMGINVRGTFAATQAALPYLKQAANPHILTLSPPLDMNPRWFRDSTAYTISKMGMSMCVIGHAAEFARYGIAVNGLWPRTFISTAALKLVPGMDWETARTPEILADCAHIVLTRDARTCTGNLFLATRRCWRRKALPTWTSTAITRTSRSPSTFSSTATGRRLAIRPEIRRAVDSPPSFRPKRAIAPEAEKSFRHSAMDIAPRVKDISALPRIKSGAPVDMTADNGLLPAG